MGDSPTTTNASRKIYPVPLFDLPERVAAFSRRPHVKGPAVTQEISPVVFGSGKPGQIIQITLTDPAAGFPGSAKQDLDAPRRIALDRQQRWQSQPQHDPDAPRRIAGTGVVDRNGTWRIKMETMMKPGTVVGIQASNIGPDGKPEPPSDNFDVYCLSGQDNRDAALNLGNDRGGGGANTPGNPPSADAIPIPVPRPIPKPSVIAQPLPGTTMTK